MECCEKRGVETLVLLYLGGPRWALGERANSFVDAGIVVPGEALAAERASPWYPDHSMCNNGCL